MISYLRLVVFALPLLIVGCATGPAQVERPHDMVLADEGFEAMQAGYMEEAERLLTQAVQENADNPYAQLNLGAVYQNTSRSELARPRFLRVLQIASERKPTESEENRAELDRLAQIARDNLALIYRQQMLAERDEPASMPESMPEPMPESKPRPLVDSPVVVTPAGFANWIQIGAFNNLAGAERLSSRFRTQHAAFIGNRDIRLTPGEGMTKVRIGPYATFGEASSACRQLRQAGVNCFPGSN